MSSVCGARGRQSSTRGRQLYSLHWCGSLWGDAAIKSVGSMIKSLKDILQFLWMEGEK